MEDRMLGVPRTSNPHIFLGDLNFHGSGKNVRNLRMAQSRRFGCPRRSRSQRWNPGGGRCLSSACVAQMLAAASIEVMDALFGLVAKNDAERYRRELLGRTWRRDWTMRQFRPKNTFLEDRKNLWGLDAWGLSLIHISEPTRRS